MAVTTGNLIETIATRYARYFPHRDDARTVVLALFNDIAGHLESGTAVRLEHLGVLRVNERAARDEVFGRPNPRAGTTVKNVTFRDSASLRRRLNP